MKRTYFSTIAKFAVLGCSLGGWLLSVRPTLASEPASDSTAAPSTPLFLPYAQFQIPFNVDARGAEPALIQLWVSTDGGASWQIHGNATPDVKHFDFRAAAEGLYLFSVHTVDAAGASFPSTSPPLRVQVDTTKPEAAIRADINAEGKLVVDVRVVDSNLDLASAVLRLRSDRDVDWREVAVPSLSPAGDIFEGQAIVDVKPCREIAVVFAIKDHANNSGEATFLLSMPRTAAGEHDMKFASSGPGQRAHSGQHFSPPANSQQNATPPAALKPIAGAIPWEPTQQRDPKPQAAPGKLVASDADVTLELTLDPPPIAEELPLPAPRSYATQAPLAEAPDRQPVSSGSTETSASSGSTELTASTEAGRSAPSTDRLAPDGQAYHCKSRAFSLDYAVEAEGGSSLADVELWGTEDGGRTWEMWGSDPDRQSPFDVQVGNDGLFGFRMVIVGANGLVSNRPKSGDSSDMWINIDTDPPTAKITRAVYGEGPEDGMLVINYNCDDNHLVERPITLSFSERLSGPWTTIVTGLSNSGSYLWKADPTLPNRIYLKLEAVDKAGNIGSDRLELPIDMKGLAPRGRIQGFRPIALPAN